MNTVLLGGIWYSSAVNNARTARIQQALAEQNQIIAENHRLALAAQAEQDRINQLRQTVFNLKKGIECLEHQAQDDPLGAYINVLEYDRSIKNWGINPNMFNEFSDKEYTSSMIEAKFNLVVQLEQTLDPAIVQKCRRYDAVRGYGIPQLKAVNDWIEIVEKYPNFRPIILCLLHPVLVALYTTIWAGAAGLLTSGWDLIPLFGWFLMTVLPAWVITLIWKGRRQTRMEELNAIAQRHGGWVGGKATRDQLKDIRNDTIAKYKNLNWEVTNDREQNNEIIANLQQEMNFIISEFQLQLTS